MKRLNYWFVILIVYILIIFYFAVLGRVPSTKEIIRLDLFQGYVQPVDNSYKDILTNIIVFIPIGLLVGLFTVKHRVIKVFVIGLLFSLSIECSQLIWQRGTFDVDDLFNNSFGAVIGGAITVLLCRNR